MATLAVQQEFDHFDKVSIEEYNKIVHSGNFVVQDQQWTKKGDGFEIFTLYNDTTPVVASSNSIVI